MNEQVDERLRKLEQMFIALRWGGAEFQDLARIAALTVYEPVTPGWWIIAQAAADPATLSGIVKVEYASSSGVYVGCLYLLVDTTDQQAPMVKCLGYTGKDSSELWSQMRLVVPASGAGLVTLELYTTINAAGVTLTLSAVQSVGLELIGLAPAPAPAGTAYTIPLEKLLESTYNDMFLARLRFSYRSYYGAGDGGAVILNDNNAYKALLLIGSNVATGTAQDRRVTVFDHLSVYKSLTVGDENVAGASPPSGLIRFKEIVQPAAPPAGYGYFYQRNDGWPCAYSDSAGNLPLGIAELHPPINSAYLTGATFVFAATYHLCASFRDGFTDTADLHFMVPYGWQGRTLSLEWLWYAGGATGACRWIGEARFTSGASGVGGRGTLSVAATLDPGSPTLKSTLNLGTIPNFAGMSMAIRLARAGTDAADTRTAAANVLALRLYVA